VIPPSTSRECGIRRPLNQSLVRNIDNEDEEEVGDQLKDDADHDDFGTDFLGTF